ncbi:hypothetical protein DV737_g5546, partial [Chaetothyriales sp. CBS 132003]
MSNMPANDYLSDESHSIQSGVVDASNENPVENTRKGGYSEQVEAAISVSRQWYLDSHPKSFTDLVGEFSAGLYGHSEPTILSALQSAIAHTGLNLGAHTRYEIEYAQLLCSRFSLEQVRFCNSGTEANLHAIMAARHFTQRRKVVVFTGGYHGGVLTFRYEPMPNTVNDTDFVVVEYNNIAAATAAIEQDSGVGAVLVEAMQGAAGNILGTREFLHAVQASAKKAGIVFILDEVQTSRLAPGGLQSILDLKPDLTTLGKYLGGGLAFGAFGGRKDIMAVFDPRTPNALGHSGTFNNNTLTMRAGYTGLTKVYTPEAALAHNGRGDVLLGQLQELCRGTSMAWTGRGTLLASHFMKTTVAPIKSIADLDEDESLKELFWLEMLKCGFWTTRRGYLAIILGTPQASLDRFLGCVGDFLRRYKPLVRYGKVES